MLALDNIESVHNTAIAAAQRAEADFRAQHGEPGYCGFAWVHVSEKASTKLGRALKSVGFRKSYQGGLDLWNPGGSGTQSMDIKDKRSQSLNPNKVLSSIKIDIQNAKLGNIRRESSQS